MSGRPKSKAHVVDEIFCITREALTNAFRHSEASQIAVQLDYQMRQFRFTCSDNGRVFDAEALQTSRPNGHWGLLGIEERAEKIGATFFCTSSVGKGTDVQVTLPAYRAYTRMRAFHLFSRKRPTA
jgi:signal transduction histidine kinase